MFHLSPFTPCRLLFSFQFAINVCCSLVLSGLRAVPRHFENPFSCLVFLSLLLFSYNIHLFRHVFPRKFRVYKLWQPCDYLEIVDEYAM